MRQTREFHFSCGNSDRGVVGFCASVHATTKAEAVEILASALPPEYETSIEENDDRIVYLTFYLNSDAVRVSQIDEIRDLEKCPDCGAFVTEVVGCPDGAEVCRDCFNAGRH